MKKLRINFRTGDHVTHEGHLCSFGPEAAVAAAVAPEVAAGLAGGAGAFGAASAIPAAASVAAPAAGAGGFFTSVAAAAKVASPFISAAGLGLQVMQGVQAGKMARAQGAAAQRASEYEAKQLETKANQERAIAQRRVLDERRRTAYAQSNLRARAAASGAGLGPGIDDLVGDIESEGEYRALSALYEGEERARGLETGAGVRRAEGESAYLAGKQRRTGYYMGAGGTLLSGGASLYEKYGAGGPRARR